MDRLQGVDMKHLAALVAVAEEQSFGRAARRLGFTQSAISQQIAIFERSIGASLFDRPRGPSAVELTPVGQMLLPVARSILSRMEAADIQLDRLLDGQVGRITVGTFQSMSVRALPSIVGRLRTERPELEIRLFETDDNNELVAWTADGRVDLAFAVDPVDDDRVEFEELCRDPFVAMSRRDRGLPDVIDRETLSDELLIGQQPSFCQALIDDGVREMGIEPEYVFRSNDNGAVQAMARAGMGIAVMPWLAVDQDDPEIRVHQLAPPIEPRCIGIVRRVGRMPVPAVEHFVELARQVARCLHDDLLDVA